MSKKVSSIAIIFTLIFSVASFADSNLDRVNDLIRDGKVPMYVRDKGEFSYNSNFDIVGINGINVNLRSQPNTKSKVIHQVSTQEVDKWPVYLGEWLHPNGEKWILGEFFEDGRKNQETSKSWSVWIFGQYAKPLSETFVNKKLAEIFYDNLNKRNSNENSNENFSDIPDDLPDDSSNTSQQTSKAASKSDSKKNFSSQEDALEFLEGKLSELEKVAMNETLEFVSEVEINNESCWVFSATFNFTETGRYAISKSGKIYELEDEKFTQIK